jgi:hypothetical protein
VGAEGWASVCGAPLGAAGDGLTGRYRFGLSGGSGNRKSHPISGHLAFEDSITDFRSTNLGGRTVTRFSPKVTARGYLSAQDGGEALTSQTFQLTADLDQLYFSLAAAANRRDYLLHWLAQLAAASSPGVVVGAIETPDGFYVVEEKWPTRAAYLEFAAARLMLEAVAKTSVGTAVPSP